MHQSTCPPGGPISCRLNICLMAISCLNMSWAKPLCERSENKCFPAGTTAMPPPKHFLWMRHLFSFPFVHPVCSPPFHGHEGLKNLSYCGQKEMNCFTWPKKTLQVCNPFPLRCISLGYPKVSLFPQSHTVFT